MASAPDTAQELLDIILDLGIPRICKTYRRPPLPSRLLRELYAIADPPEARRFIAAYPLSPSDLLEVLSLECNDPEALAAAALNPRTPSHLLSRLAESPVPEVRQQAALNPQLAPRDMRLLARDIDYSVRVAAASNPSLKPPVMAELAEDGEPAVRTMLAAHPSLLPEVRFTLNTDLSPIVRSELVAHCEDEEALLFWADSDLEDFQSALLERKELPEAVGRSLLHSPHAGIRATARERFAPEPAERLAIARKGTREERLWLSEQPELPPALQRVLSQDEDPEVRVRLAAHPAIHRDIAAHFITMHDEACCEALAGNPATPPDLLLALARSGIPAIPPLLGYRKDLSATVLAYFLAEAPSDAFLRHLAMSGQRPKDLPRAVLTPFAEHPLPTVRKLVAAWGELTPEQRATLREDPAASVRQALCTNPDTTDLELEEMLDDDEPAVAAAARSRWQTNRRAHARTEPPPEALAPSPPSFPDEELSTSSDGSSPGSGVLRRLKRIFV